MRLLLKRIYLNLARSVGVAVIHGDWALEQLWVFAVAQLIAVFLALTVCLSKISRQFFKYYDYHHSKVVSLFAYMYTKNDSD